MSASRIRCLAAACAGAVAPGIAACSSHTPPPTTVVQSDPCTGDAGDFPSPSCDDTPESCAAPVPACATAPCSASSPCLAMADNRGKPTLDFRLRKLNVAAPQRLALAFVQAAVIDQGIELPNLCGESGDGSFNWLLRFDTHGAVLTTGGGPRSNDPLGVGYCFARETVGNLPVGPVTTSLTSDRGTWSSGPIAKIYVPIYDPANGGDPIVLPITGARLRGVTISPDSNCIGAYNPSGVTSTCADQSPALCQRWHTAGSLGGYVTLQEAEQVYVRQVQETLCALLTTGVGGAPHCARDAAGNVTVAGDYCSLTEQPGGCADSDWLAATFAASAVLIDESPTDPHCTGGSAGSDAGTLDASPEAGSASQGDAATE